MGSLTTKRGARLIRKWEDKACAVLTRLVQVGLAEARNERKGRTRHLSAATYERLAAEPAYVRQRGFELLQKNMRDV